MGKGDGKRPTLDRRTAGKVLLGGWGRTGSPAFHASMAMARIVGDTLQLDPSFGLAGTGRMVIDDFESAFLRVAEVIKP